MQGMAGILASGVAPAFIGSKILMPVRQIIVPELKDITLDTIILRLEPALHIAKNYGEVLRWDDNYRLIPESDPWNEIDAKLRR